MILTDNKVLRQCRTLLRSAINLKEGFDKKQSLKVLQPLNQNYQIEFLQLERIVPADVINQTLLVRHSQWLDIWIRDGEIDRCYSDISEICFTDILDTEQIYIEHIV